MITKVTVARLRLKHDWMSLKNDILVRLLKGEGKEICQKIDILVHVLKGNKKKI